ncbi:dihydroneopterin aldolase [Salinispirillum sp. LH 10-3-1]|uniref:dihydroneopterin aldolase n=1 Tax=Salinispirillum sp. LH 10-3-1 TaxID=2952525 RepID=A0AB38YEB7_9GAMM
MTNPIAPDRLVIRNLQVPTLIGVYDFERLAPQTLRLDITLHTDIRQAGETDDLQYTLNYAAVAESVVAFGAAATFELLEAFATKLCVELFQQYAVPQVDLVIYKDGCIPGAQGAELHLSRRRDDAGH